MGNGAILISEVGERASDEFVAAIFSSEFAPDFSLQPASESLFVPRGSQVRSSRIGCYKTKIRQLPLWRKK
jgi:hypothetical protein